MVIALLLAGFFLRFIVGGDEDTGIKDKTGEYVEHSVPSNTPGDVPEQQITISRAMQLFQEKRAEGINFSSQCLGTIGNYSVDIVHNPRTEEDNIPENQCRDFLEDKTKHFIELDKYGNIIRVV